MHLKMSSGKWLPFCLDLSVLTLCCSWPAWCTNWDISVNVLLRLYMENQNCQLGTRTCFSSTISTKDFKHSRPLETWSKMQIYSYVFREKFHTTSVKVHKGHTWPNWVHDRASVIYVLFYKGSYLTGFVCFAILDVLCLTMCNVKVKTHWEVLRRWIALSINSCTAHMFVFIQMFINITWVLHHGCL